MYFVRNLPVYNMYRATLLIFCVFIGVQSSLYFNEQCNRDDNACVTRFADHLINVVVKGDPSKKMKKLDPMHQNYIEGTFAITKYKLYNSTVVGFKDCRVVNAQIVSEKNLMYFNFICPYLYMYGRYVISGHLIIVPIEGNGDYRLDAKDYHFNIEAATKIIQGNDGEKHLQFKNFKATADLRGGMVTDVTNLFNGKYKDLADAALKFANTHWKLVANEFQGPVITTNVKTIVKSLNKYLKTVSINKFIIY